jgi:glycosyltransferase involved in cell wall biosynthesis
MIKLSSDPGDAPVASRARRRLRIAVLNRVFRPTGGGAERYSIALVEQLASRHELHVFAQQIDHQWPGVTYHKISAPLTKPRWMNQLWYAAATWWATRRGFDVVHSHENTWHGQVQTVHVLPIKYNLLHGRTGWRRALGWLKISSSPRLLAYLGMEGARFSGKNLCSVVVTSTALRNIVAASYPVCAAKLTVITPGVTIPSESPSKAQARQTLGLPLRERLIGFVGNNYKKKGLDTLLRALKQLGADVGLVVVGDPSHIQVYEQKAAALGLKERVHFLGHMKDVSHMYRAVDCLAHPTTEDTFAMVVLEAMAHGLPVVVSDERYCGISGLLSDGLNALLLSSPDLDGELASLLRSVMENEEVRLRLSEQAVLFARQYSWSRIAQAQEDIYEACLAPHPLGAPSGARGHRP